MPSVGQEHEYCVTSQLYSDPCCLYEDLRPPHPHLFAVVCDRGEDGAKGLEAHGDVQQVGRKEEVVEVSKNGHGGVPDQIQEVLQENKALLDFSLKPSFVTTFYICPSAPVNPLTNHVPVVSLSQ